jgi:ATP synthase protein I
LEIVKSLDRVVFYQIVTGTAISLLIFCIFGKNSGLSALLGAVSCIVPTGLVVFIMKMISKGVASPLAFFVCEFTKVAITIACFVLVALLYKELNWPSFVLSIGAVLFSHLFVLASKR